MGRTFEDKEAVRTAVPLLVGLMGPSGGGKTYSALRLATGIQKVTGGEIFMIDTEARRGLHYAGRFKFRHLEFGAPFGPLDYLAAIEHCVSKGARTIIVDSMSHEHEGPGGVLEQHEAECDRLAEIFHGRDKASLSAWAKPKADRRRLINSILQMSINAIFCFRAKDKVKPGVDERGKKALIPQGFMAIAGDEFVYEMTVSTLLLPAANGVPTWQPTEIGERQMVKLPAQFRDLLLGRNGPLDESVGESLAQWAQGGDQLHVRLAKAIADAKDATELALVKDALTAAKKDKTITYAQAITLGDAFNARQHAIAATPPAQEEGREPGDES